MNTRQFFTSQILIFALLLIDRVRWPLIIRRTAINLPLYLSLSLVHQRLPRTVGIGFLSATLPALMDANSTTMVLRWRFLISGSSRVLEWSASRTNYTLLDPDGEGESVCVCVCEWAKEYFFLLLASVSSFFWFGSRFSRLRSFPFLRRKDAVNSCTKRSFSGRRMRGRGGEEIPEVH